MSTAAPLPMRWDGESFRPVSRRWAEEADRRFVIGEVYPVAPVEERSRKSHDHEFAAVTEAWKSLPEHLADLYPTSEHLRKRALVEAGFYDETIVDAGTTSAAVRVAAAFRARPGEEFSLVVVRGPAVVIRTPKSQSRRHMDRAEFQASKDGVLRVLAEMLGTSPERLAQARAA